MKKELELRGRAVGDHKYAAPRLRYPYHLAQRAGLIGNQHYAELGPADIESVVREVERVAIHHEPLCTGQGLLANALLEAFDHRRGPVGGEHLRPEARRRQTQAPSPRRDVEEGSPAFRLTSPSASFASSTSWGATYRS
jgi:hypothetical protein